MKNIYYALLISITFCFTAIYAQPIITSSVFGAVGESYVMKSLNTASFDAGDAGADVTWDFSGIDFNGGTEIRDVVESSTSLYGSTFPDANIALITDDTSFTYYYLTTDEFTLYGTATPSLIQTFDDPAQLASFPVTYMDSTIDDFAGSSTILGYDVNLTGTADTHADGYGTLNLPGQNYSNVLRTKTELNMTGEVIGFPLTVDINTIIYYWLMDGIIGPAMQYQVIETTVFGSPSTSSYAYVNADLISDVKNISEQNFLVIFPNPASDYIMIQNAGKNRIEKISMFDISGKLVETTPKKILQNEKIQIDVSTLSAGMYVINAQTDAGILNAKILLNN